MKIKRVLVTIVSLLYSMFLLACSIFMAGAGDGSYVFLGLFFAPIPLLLYLLGRFESWIGYGIQMNDSVLLLGMLLLWILVGLLGTLTDKMKRRFCLGGFLAIHYVSAAITLGIDDFVKWKRFALQTAGVEWLVILILMIYLLGQIWLWKQLLKKPAGKLESSRPPPEPRP